jgi:hypothetical protein
MPSHAEAIARRMIARLAPGPADEERPSSPTDETTDESATGSTLLSGGDVVVTFAPTLAAAANLAWSIYESFDPAVVARRDKARERGDMPALQRETARLKEMLVNRLHREAVTPRELPETVRTRILDAAAEEVLAESSEE